MLKLTLLEIKSTLRSLEWMALLAIAALIFSKWVVPTFYLGLELPLFEVISKPCSLGEWGRGMLLVMESWGGIPAAILSALLAIKTLSLELAHREIIWATPKGFALFWPKLFGRSFTATVSIVIGAGFIFMTPSARAGFVLAGGSYLPLYLVLVWLRILMWTGAAALFYYLVRSRWAAIVLVGAVQIAWFGTAGFWTMPDLIRLLHRNLLSWNFIGPFSPLGLIPSAFLGQLLGTFGLVLALSGGGLLLRRRLHRWGGNGRSLSSTLLVLGLCMASGGVALMERSIWKNVAPYTAEALWDKEAELKRPYIWSRDFRFLFCPGRYICLRLPPETEVPPWFVNLVGAKRVQRCPDAGSIIIRGHLGEELQVEPHTVVMAYPPRRPWPPELDGTVNRFWEDISPLIDRAQLWLKREEVRRLTVQWPIDITALASDMVEFVEGGLCIGYLLLYQDVRERRWETAWALTAPASQDGPTRVYLAMYLVDALDGKEVQLVLERLRYIEQGEEAKFYEKYGIVRMFQGFYSCARAPGGAEEILQHWRRGEELGHESYILTLLGEETG